MNTGKCKICGTENAKITELFGGDAIEVIAHVPNVAGPMVQPAWDFRQG
jgi:hypothetical protein